MTPDLRRARAFYAALFGWGIVIRPPGEGDHTICQVGGRNACGMGQLYPGFVPSWTAYFNVDDMDAVCASIRKNGGKVLMPPADIVPQGRLGLGMDPTGAYFGLWQPWRHLGAEVADEHGAMTWQEVLSRNAEQARDFYAAVFGLQARKMEGMTYWTLHKGSKTYAGVRPMDGFPADVPAHWLVYFAVNDADAIARRAAELGGQVYRPPYDTPYGRVAILSDLFGAVFAVVKLAPRAQQG